MAKSRLAFVHHTPLEGGFPDDAPESCINYVDDISCIPSYFHKLRRTDGAILRLQAATLTVRIYGKGKGC